MFVCLAVKSQAHCGLSLILSVQWKLNCCLPLANMRTGWVLATICSQAALARV